VMAQTFIVSIGLQRGRSSIVSNNLESKYPIGPGRKVKDLDRGGGSSEDLRGVDQATED
jgi:hypothetical protein